MDVIFLLLRLPFFVIAMTVWLFVTAFAVYLALYLVPFVVLVVLAVWLVILVPANFLRSALNNNSALFEKFLRDSLQWVQERLSSAWKFLAEYFEILPILCRWLGAGNKALEGE
jgi:hypothetical protein